MQIQRSIRYFVIVVSLIIFCYQMRVAIENLKSNATADSTENISISDINTSPVITFCPKQGADFDVLKEFGYTRYYGDTESNSLMQGKKCVNIFVSSYLYIEDLNRCMEYGKTVF